MPSGWRGSTWIRGTDIAWTGSKVNIAKAREAEIDRRRGRGEVAVGPTEGTSPVCPLEGIVTGTPAD